LHDENKFITLSRLKRPALSIFMHGERIDGNMLPIQVAIDGPAGAGKSTVAKLVARQLGAKYIDTGAMYRAVGWLAINEDIDPENEEEIIHLAESLRFTLTDSGIQVNGYHLTSEIRTEKISAIASAIATLGGVREVLVDKQRRLAGEQSVVMDGRDVGTHVLPNANIKIFLTASIDKRVERRFHELKKKGEAPSLDSLRQEVIQRDFNDKNRQFAPLRRAADAILLDTTDMTTKQVVNQIIQLCRTKLGGEE
jgi:CMP/dCMP kinase